MDYHELANIFPLIEGEEFDALVEDIKSNGLLDPIWLYEGKILDGRNRYRACEVAGVDASYRTYDGASPVSFVVSVNMKRRHLTGEQRDVLALKLLPLLRVEAEKRLHLAQGQGVKVLSNDSRLDRNESMATAQAGALVGRSHASIARAAKFIKDNPDYEESILSGERTISEIKQEEKKDEKQRRDLQLLKDAQVAIQVSKQRHDVHAHQLWRMGEHLLYCGDSASQEFTSLVNHASFAFADPPYNANVDTWDNGFLWGHDYLTRLADVVAVTPGINAIQHFMRATSMLYKWSMAYHITNGQTVSPLGFNKWLYIALFAETNAVHRDICDYYKITCPDELEDGYRHKGKKPLVLLLHLLDLFTEEKQVVIDPFMGSGTTLIACEMKKRVCVGADIEPEYCQMAIARWEGLTGEIAENVY